jgi:hypothetical protein
MENASPPKLNVKCGSLRSSLTRASRGALSHVSLLVELSARAQRKRSKVLWSSVSGPSKTAAKLRSIEEF